MPYDISLLDPTTGEILIVPQHTEGSTFTQGVSFLAELSIIFNYGKFYYEHLDNDQGLYFLNGKTGAETLPVLERCIRSLGTEASVKPFYTLDIYGLIDKKTPEWFIKLSREVDSSFWNQPENSDLKNLALEKDWLSVSSPYWNPTPGNAGVALVTLKSWAELHPSGVWSIKS